MASDLPAKAEGKVGGECVLCEGVQEAKEGRLCRGKEVLQERVVALAGHDELQEIVGAEGGKGEVRPKGKEGESGGRGFDHDPAGKCRRKRDTREAKFLDLVLEGGLEVEDLVESGDHRKKKAQIKAGGEAEEGAKVREEEGRAALQEAETSEAKGRIAFGRERHRRPRFIRAEIQKPEGDRARTEIRKEGVVVAKEILFRGEQRRPCLRSRWKRRGEEL